MISAGLTRDARLTGKSLSTPSDLTLLSNPDAFAARQERIREAVKWWAGPEMHQEFTEGIVEIRSVDRDGFRVTTLWLPFGKGRGVGANVYAPEDVGLHPAILNPHGHWPRGRFEDTDLASVPARCANMARRGYVALSYDMVGYGDSVGVDHRLEESSPELQAWGLSLFGLQMQVGLAFLDYLDKSPYVDSTRIGCTGASGGGSQTIALALIDERIAAVAPVNMVSAHCQGWCTCENPPGLRYEYDNLDFVSALAPKPLLIISCTGDWTKNTPEVEYPHIRRAYSVLDAGDLVTNIHIDSSHNFNMESRQSVYRWFDRVLSTEMSDDDYLEIPIPPTPHDLLSASPTGVGDEREIASSMLDIAKFAEAELMQGDRRKLEVALRTCLGLLEPPAAPKPLRTLHHLWDGVVAESHLLQGADYGCVVPVVVLLPDMVADAPAIVAAELTSHHVLNRHAERIRELLDAGRPVVVIDALGNGGWTGPLGPLAPAQQMAFATTYNRTQTMEQVRDIYQAGRYATQRWAHESHVWIGLDRLGTAMLAAAALSPDPVRVLVDIASELRKPGLFGETPWCPGFLRSGGMEALLRMCGDSRVRLCVPDAYRDAAQVFESSPSPKNLTFGKSVAEEAWNVSL